MYQIKHGLDKIVQNYGRVSAYVSLFGAFASLFIPSNAIAQEAYQEFKNPQSAVAESYDENNLALKNRRRKNLEKTVNIEISDLLSGTPIPGAIVTVRNEKDGSEVDKIRLGDEGYVKLKRGSYIFEFSSPDTSPQYMMHRRIVEVKRNTTLKVGLMTEGWYERYGKFLQEVDMNNTGAAIPNGTVMHDKSLPLTHIIYAIDANGNRVSQDKIDLVVKILENDFYAVYGDCIPRPKLGDNIKIVETPVTLPPPWKTGVRYVYWAKESRGSTVEGGLHRELLEVSTNLVLGGEFVYNPDLDINNPDTVRIYEQEALQLTIRNDSNLVRSIFNTPEIKDPPFTQPGGVQQVDKDVGKYNCNRDEGTTYPDDSLMKKGKSLKTSSIKSRDYLKRINYNYLSHVNKHQKWFKRAA